MGRLREVPTLRKGVLHAPVPSGRPRTVRRCRLALSGSAFAHGTLSKPLSRVKQCHEGNPENPTNRPAPPPRPSAARSRSTTGPASPGHANGNHQAVVPDGELCSGGNSKYRGLDLNRSDWPTSPIRADSRGPLHLRVQGTGAARHPRVEVLRHPRRLAAGQPAALGRPAGILHAGQRAALRRRLQAGLPAAQAQRPAHHLQHLAALGFGKRSIPARTCASKAVVA
jgi:hypothetical protein